MHARTTHIHLKLDVHFELFTLEGTVCLRLNVKNNFATLFLSMCTDSLLYLFFFKSQGNPRKTKFAHGWKVNILTKVKK